jgi:clathrin heavy chain
VSDHCAHTPFEDNAALAMIERSSDAWEHNQFKDVIVRAANVEMQVNFFNLLDFFNVS